MICGRRTWVSSWSSALRRASPSVVTLDDDGESVVYTIVGADESDPVRGRISSSSPVGRALVGRDAGDYVVVQTPAGEARYRIVDIA